MTRLLRPGIALFLASCLALPGTAAATPVFDSEISTHHISVEESYHLEAPVLAFLQENVTTPCAANPRFNLHTSRLVVENDTSNLSIHSADTYHPIFNGAAQTSHEEFEYSSVQGVANRAGCRLNLFSLPGYTLPRIQIQGDCASVMPSNNKEIVRYPILPNKRKESSADTSMSLRWQDCSQSATVQVSGDFQLSLWNWDAFLSDGEGTRLISTGPSQSPLLPGEAPDVSNVVSRDQEVYLFVHNGTLTTTLEGFAGLIYVGDANAEATKVEVTSATGSLHLGSATQELHTSYIGLAGLLQVSMRATGQGGPMDAHLTGSPSKLVVDGMAIPIPETGNALARLWAWWVLGGLGAVLAPTLWVPIRRRSKAAREHRLTDLSRQAMECLVRGDNDKAEDLAIKILDLDPDNAQGHFVMGLCCTLFLEFDEAMQHYQATEQALLHSTSMADRELLAQNALQAASTLAQWGVLEPRRKEEIMAWLERALALRPELIDELEEYEALGKYLPASKRGDPAFG